MPTTIEPAGISGAYVVRFQRFGDERGYFNETWRRNWIPGVREMIQGNTSFSKAGVLRGLHYHMKQADLWGVPSGHVRAVLFDFRESSPTFRRAEVHEMGDVNPIGLYIPKGVAHGFVALTDSFMTYLVDEYYDGADELGIAWNDPELGVDWGVTSPNLSARDLKNPRITQIPTNQRPR